MKSFPINNLDGDLRANGPQSFDVTPEQPFPQSGVELPGFNSAGTASPTGDSRTSISLD